MNLRVLSLLLLLLSATSFGQVIDGRFINFTFDDGLSSSNTTCLAKDHMGFMWIGTEEGLNRFDGQQFKTFLKDDGEAAIAGNYITAIEVLPDDRLLVGTLRSGLCMYDPKTERFSKIASPARQDSLPMIWVGAFLPADAGKYYVGYRQRGGGTTGGLVLLDPNTGEGELLCSEIDEVASLLKDEEGILWIGNDRLWRYDPAGGDAEQYLFENRSSRFRGYIQDMAWDGTQILLATFGEGLLAFDPNDRVFTEQWLYDESGKRDANRNMMRRIVRGEGDSWWVATGDKGLGRFYKEEENFAFYEHDPADPTSIFHISARDILVDEKGIVWAAMASGLSVLSDYVYQIKYERLGFIEDLYNQRMFGYTQVIDKGDWWVVAASGSNGFYRLNKNDLSDRQVIATGMGDESRYGFSGVELVKTNDQRVFTMHRNAIWEVLVAEGEAEQVFDLNSRASFEGRSGDINTLRALGNDIWFGTDDNIIGVWHTESDSFEYWWIEGEGVQEIRNLVYELAFDGSGKLWLACEKGIYSFNGTQVESLAGRSASYAELIHLDLESIVATGSKVFFGAKDEGLFMFDTQELQVQRFGRKEGLPNMRVAEMTVDLQGKVWGVTAGGVFSFDPASSDPLAVYTLIDGLRSTDLVQGEICTLSTGEVIVSNGLGFEYFKPEELLKQPVPDALVITDCRVQGESIPGVQPAEITVPYGASLELTLQALGYVKPDRYLYYFKRAGDDIWQQISGRQLSFNVLEEGLEIDLIAANERGEKMAEPLSITICVQTPFYLRTWFFVIIGIIVIGLFLFWNAMRIKGIREREALQTEYNKKLAEVEMSALRAQMNPHFLFNCLNSIKYFIINKETDQASDYLTKFSRLIRLILSNSKSELIPLHAELEALQLYVELESLRFDQQFTFELEVSPSLQTEFIDVPPMIIQPFAENAIWHGLLHKKGAGTLRIRISEQDGCLLCVVEDDGVGRKKAAELRSKSATRQKSMGMDITRNRLMRLSVEGAEDRQLEIEDLEGPDGSPSGTRVTIRIPIR